MFAGLSDPSNSLKLAPVPDSSTDVSPANTSDQKASPTNSYRRSKVLWIDLVDQLRKDPATCMELRSNLDLLCVSKATLSKTTTASDTILTIINVYGNQNCLRALSVVADLTSIKKNQYKFMYEKLSLAEAVDLLITETRFLAKSLSKHKSAHKQFFRLVRTWVDYVNMIHRVPEDAQEELKDQVVVHISLLNGMEIL
jgi:hypothetical protein